MAASSHMAKLGQVSSITVGGGYSLTPCKYLINREELHN